MTTNNLDADIIEVDVLAFDNDQFHTKYRERLHDHGLCRPDNQELMRTELRQKLKRCYPYFTKVVYDERIGKPMLVPALR